MNTFLNFCIYLFSYTNKQKASQRRDQKDMSQLAKISNNTNDTYYIVSGIGKNL